MSTKTGRFVPTVFVLAVLGVAAWIMLPSLVSDKQKREGGKLVTVTVVFTPAVRECRAADGRQDLAEGVSISLKVGPDIHPLERECRSPWAITVYPYRGQVVDVRAEQRYGADVGCRIIQLGAPPVERTRVGPGLVNCRHTVI